MKQQADGDKVMRLNKFLAHAGITSRRGADQAIQEGRVSVNGRTIYVMGTKVHPDSDAVMMDGVQIRLSKQEPTTLMLNKPSKYLSTRSDDRQRPTVMDLLPPQYQHLHPVGRLDFMSEGLLLMSDDGDLTYRLTHPSFEHEKEYWVQVFRNVPEPAIRKLRKGVEIDGGLAQARVRKLEQIPIEQRFWMETEIDPWHTWLIFTLQEGRKRQIRQMCAAVDLHIRRLVRVRVGSLHIGDLRPREWRQLTARQQRAVAAIKAGESKKRSGSRT